MADGFMWTFAIQCKGDEGRVMLPEGRQRGAETYAKVMIIGNSSLSPQPSAALLSSGKVVDY